MSSQLTFPRLTINYAQQDSSSLILPQPPLAASITRQWRGINIYCYSHAEHETPLHYLAQHCLVITLCSASLEFRLGGSLYNKNLVEGNIQLIPAHTPYFAAWSQPIRFMVIALESMGLSETANERENQSLAELIPQFLDSDPLIYGIGQALRQELIDGGNHTLYIDSLSNCLSAHLLRHYAASQSNKKFDSKSTKGLSQYQLNTVIDYIHQHLDQNLSLAILSAQIHLSPSYLSRLFQKTTGITLHRYVIQCRIDRAKHLLQHGNLSIGAISLDVGFANQQHFTRQFRQLTGITPSAFRKTVL